MAQISEENRYVWLWLLNDGGAWTVAALALKLRRNPERLFDQLNRMANNDLIERLPPLEGGRRLRYAVTGTCRVPLGLHVAEVQV